MRAWKRWIWMEVTVIRNWLVMKQMKVNEQVRFMSMFEVCLYGQQKIDIKHFVAYMGRSPNYGRNSNIFHITNGLNFMHRKWYTGNQYMVKSAENRMRSNLELLQVINVKSRPRYISALKKSRPRYVSAQRISTLFWCTEWAWNWQIIIRFASIHGRACFNRWKEHPYIVLQYTPKSTQK
jgi:hypothetical protein